MVNFQPNFSHIYVDRDALDFELTDLTLSKFPRATVIKIGHYKDVFNRPGQDFQIQKSSMKLILAKKTEPFLYPASDMVQEFGTPNVYYNTPILNCLYNCDYCYLQGMYPSGNVVVFVNEYDFMDAINLKLNELDDPLKPMVVSISYNTDIMAMENIIPMTSRWIKFVDTQENLKIEVRTKSALFSSINNTKPSENVILSWTLSPDSICQQNEPTAPPLQRRLGALKEAMANGWQVRICFDPVLLVEGWYDIYTRFFDEVFNKIDCDKLLDITLGVFRMNKDYFNRIRKRESRSELFYANYSIEKGTVIPDKKVRYNALDQLEDKIAQFFPRDKILVWR